MSRLATLATRYAGRPLLLTPRAAEDLANRMRAVDPRALEKPSRIGAVLRKLAGPGRGRPQAMDDSDDYTPVPMEARLAYAPLYLGEPEDVGFCWSLNQGVALMQCDTALTDRGEEYCGVVYHGYDTLLRGMREAMADERVKGLFIRLSTPGGVVAGGLPALAEFMRANGARAGGKPIWVYADMACSAGYWIAASADRIVAPRVGLIGSIGAVIVHEDWSAALKEHGIAIEAIQFGAKKTDGAWWSKLSERAREDLQAEIDQCGRDFVADVMAGRPQLSEETILGTEAGVFMAAHDDDARSGLALQLVDEIASEESAFAALRDQVAANTDPLSAPSPGKPAADAPRGRASASPVKTAKEADMANKPKAGGKPSRKAQADQALRRAQAEVARLKAEAAQAETDEDETSPAAEDEDENKDAPASEDTPAEEGEGAGEADDDEDDDDAPASKDAKRISASHEASAHPGLALTAISTGQSFAQFQANVKAATGGGRNQLKAALSGSTRLGADAPPQSPATAASRSARDTYKANRAAAMKRT